jgi:hypothetical protein
VDTSPQDKPEDGPLLDNLIGQLLAGSGITVPRPGISYTVDDIESAAERLGIGPDELIVSARSYRATPSLS